jgi:hypothetical protein
MSRFTRSVAMCGLVMALCSCGSDDPQPTRSVKPVASAVPAETPQDEIVKGTLGKPAAVPATANIFGAGRDEPPGPGGGGGGDLPPVWDLPDRSKRVIVVSDVTGKVTPRLQSYAPHSAAGAQGATDIESTEGISGIVHRDLQMFLTGVFLTDDAPAGKAPERLSYKGREPRGDVAPRIRQTFLVGDGRGQAFVVPARATRLFLGFAKAHGFLGRPGWYSVNSGEVVVTIDLKQG